MEGEGGEEAIERERRRGTAAAENGDAATGRRLSLSVEEEGREEGEEFLSLSLPLSLYSHDQ